MSQPKTPIGRSLLEEFAETLGWEDETINDVIGRGRKVQTAANKAQRRNLEFAAGFDPAERNAELSLDTKYRLYAAIVYTRGEVVQNPPCEYCRNEETRVFATRTSSNILESLHTVRSILDQASILAKGQGNENTSHWKMIQFTRVEASQC